MTSTKPQQTNEGPLQLREQRLAEACQAAKLGYWEANPTEDTLWWSDVVYHILGFDPACTRASAELFHDHVLPEDAGHVRAALSEARELGHCNLEYRILRSDGQETWVREQLRYYRDETLGEELLTGTIQDITGLTAVNEQLRHESRHNQTILENIADGIIAIDGRGRIISFNPAASRIFGYSPDEVIGCNVSMLMPEPIRSAHDGYLEHYLSTGEQRIIGAPREVEAIRSDGTLFALELHVSEVPGPETATFLGVVRDISERKRLERMKREFVSTVSHELRSPLTSIAGSLGMVASGTLGDLPPKARQMIELADRNVNQLTAIINDLLDMEKLVSGRMPLNCQPVSVYGLVQTSLENIQTFADQQKVTIILTPKKMTGIISVDEGRFQQIMANLLSNAIKFSPPNDRIEIDVAASEDWVRVSVRDNGPGVPADFRDRIFQKFAQADSSDSRRKGGTGLGLAITRELTEQMGGKVGFESVEGEGATFHVGFPTVEPDMNTRA